MDNFPGKGGNVRRGGTAVAMRRKGPGDQVSNVAGLVIGIIFSLVGVSLAASAVIMRELPMAIFAVVWLIMSLTSAGSCVKALAAGKKKPTQPAPVRRTMAPEEVTHEHIRATGIGKEKQLEQLEVLRGAGLYSEEEYKEKRKEILTQR